MEKHIGYSLGIRSDHDCHELMFIFKELDLPRSLIFKMFEDNIGSVELFLDWVDNRITIDLLFPYTENPASVLSDELLMEVMENPYFDNFDNATDQIITFKPSITLKKWAMEQFDKMADNDWDWR